MGSTRRRNSRAELILDRIIDRGRGWRAVADGKTAQFYVITLTPDLANEVIEHCNLKNRTIRQNKVLEWLGYMKTGHWLLMGPILMTDHGVLVDGQHRIRAVVDYGQPVEFILHVIPNGKAPEYNRYLDVGTPRNLADYLHYHDVADASRVAPVLIYERNARISGNPLQRSKGMKPDYLTLWNEIGADLFKHIFDIMPRGLHATLGVNKAFLDWFALHALRVDDGAAELFFGLLADPSELKKTDAPYVLRECLMDLQRRTQKVSLVQQAHMTAKGWKFFGEGLPCTPGKIKHKLNEDWPGIFGEEDSTRKRAKK
jgi:hypothetical protein